MNVYKNISRLPAFKNSVITIGTFDGVHLGHVQILEQLKKEAEEINGTMVLVTFYPHPKQVINSKQVFMLNTPLEKYKLLENHGIEHIVEVPFNRDFADQPAKEYISEFLVNNFHPHTIIIGYDHKFGKNREGNYKLLESESNKYNFIVKEIPEQVIRNITVSSTVIREALSVGDVKKANQCLGYNYQLTGIVVQGDKRGRTIGFPTANIQVLDKNKLIPANGVYVVNVKVENKLFKGMLNIGNRPTFNGISNSIEVYIIDFNEDIYGKEITVEFLKWLRPEVKFNSLDELKSQLTKDLEQTKIFK